MTTRTLRLTVVVALTFVLSLGTAATAKRIAPQPEPPTVRPPPPPALIVKDPSGKTKPIELRKVMVDTRIVGYVAETSLTMTFYNPHDRVLEGDLYVPLPQGSTVSGYALDVGGQLVDGVVVTKDKARQVFEKEVRKGVDPGIVEWTQGNNFKTRIFPLPAKGVRTIRLSYVGDVVQTRDGARYQLPLNFRNKVGELSLRVEVVKSPAPPLIVKGGPKGLKFASARNSYLAEATLKNSTITDDLVVALPPAAKSPVRVQRSSDGTAYFSIVDTALNTPVLARLIPKRIGITWDASLSRSGRDLTAELGLLKRYLSRMDGTVVVELSVLRNDLEMVGTWRVSPGKIEGLLSAIKALQYDGGTQLGVLGTEKRSGKRDLNLLFSDGISNFGLEMPAKLDAPTWVINSSSTANHALLRHIATQSGGAYLNLKTVDAGRALDSIGQAVYQFLGASVQGGSASELFPKLRQPAFGSFAVAGTLKGTSAKVTLKYGVGTKVMGTRTFKVEASEATDGEMLRRYWAQKQVDDLLVFTEKNAEKLTRIGQRYSIVTPGTSLIVLETLGQYVEHRIRPPKMLAKMRTDYDNRVEALDSAVKTAEASKLESIVKLWESRKKWWGTKFKYPKNYKVGAVDGKKDARGRRTMNRAPAPSSADSPAVEAEEESASGGEPSAKVAKAKKKAGGRQAPEPGVAMKPWNPDTPYLRAIKAAPKSKRYVEYLKQRIEHGTAPAFFLDCSDYFRKEGDARLALRILSSIAELELENAALIRVLAHRLAQVDELDLAAGLFVKAKQLRPEEPQSFRDLALVLARRATANKLSSKSARRADFEEAIALFSKVVMNRWDRFAEIEVMALTELNNIWPLAKAAGAKKHGLDPRLIARLDMDIRIVMSWDADMTDMDLHVVEPSGEEAYYSHNRTKIGGMVSRDFTRGYGPEVYAIRRAMKGTYAVKTKYFGSSAAKLSGGVTLQVDVFTNYGRPNEKRRSVTLRLTSKKETFTVAEIEF